jgi:hypothetical protein
MLSVDRTLACVSTMCFIFLQSASLRPALIFFHFVLESKSYFQKIFMSQTITTFAAIVTKFSVMATAFWAVIITVTWVRKRIIPTERSPVVREVTTKFADRMCHVVSVTDFYGRIFGFLDRSSYFFFQVAPRLYSRGWVNSVPDPPLLRKCSSAGNRSRTSGSVAKNSDY